MFANLIRAGALTSAILVPAATFAQGAPPAPSGGHGEFAKVREACRNDIARFCADVKPGDGRIRECLKAHVTNLSDGCKAATKEAREHRRSQG